MREINVEGLRGLQKLVDDTIGHKEQEELEEQEISLKDTQLICIEKAVFARQKPVNERAAPYFFEAEKFYKKAEEARANKKDDMATRRYKTANKWYAKGFKKLYSEVLLEQDYYALRHIIKHYSASLNLCDQPQRVVDELRRIGRFLMNRQHWWTAQVALDEAVELIEEYKLSTNGKEQRYLNLTNLMTRGEAFQTALEDVRELSITPITRTELIEFAEKEGLLKDIGCIRYGK
ncbi:MAG: hypothetical protein HY363_03130 [Candidatus Aenigmarchaeota archaeon]|nr:hypothetical protein [Candidatus Aenigmarchaeota archaeon]